MNTINTEFKTELPKDFEQMIKLNQLQPNQFAPQFDIYKDFELREVIEKTNQSSSSQSTSGLSSNDLDIDQLNQMVQTLPFVNDNIRANLKFGMEIYKQLNNFDRIYIHNIINEYSIESSESKNSK
jgi:hypothetical protein